MCVQFYIWVSFWGHSYLLLRFPMQPHTLSMEGHARTSVAEGMRSAWWPRIPCSIYQRDNCGRYRRLVQKLIQAVLVAQALYAGKNEYCKTENDAPTCVKKSTAVGYDSAGVSYVNGQRTNNNENHDQTSNSASNSNPYANANAPPAPADPAGGYHQVNSGSNLGYPAYPSNSASNSGF